MDDAMPRGPIIRVRAAALLDADGVASLNVSQPRGPEGRTTPRTAATGTPRDAAPPGVGGGLEVTLRGVPGECVADVLDIRPIRDDLPSADDPLVIDLCDAALLPALVNAHTHLDLSHIGPRPFDPARGFAGFARLIISERHTDPGAIADSVRLGVDRSLDGGVVAVGDVAGAFSAEPVGVLTASRLGGVSFVELFGHGERATNTIRAARDLARLLDDRGCFRDGVLPAAWSFQPHAPYSAGLAVYAECARLVRAAGTHASVLTTHLAESPEERDFVANAAGPFRELLDELGVLDDTALADLGRGRSPVEHVAQAMSGVPTIIAHANDVNDHDLDRLVALQLRWRDAAARMGSDAIGGVAYCPRSSAYFGHDTHFGPHRYQEMADAGVNVMLGTDSIVNLPDDEADRLSPLDDARLLWRRDGADPCALVGMITTNPARALGLDDTLFVWPRGMIGEQRPGDGPPTRIAGPIAVTLGEGAAADPAARVFAGRQAPCLLWDGAAWRTPRRANAAPPNTPTRDISATSPDLRTRRPAP
jgi:cytosine/adenosine deaminase-related metal-dependent hydrolase